MEPLQDNLLADEERITAYIQENREPTDPDTVALRHTIGQLQNEIAAMQEGQKRRADASIELRKSRSRCFVRNSARNSILAYLENNQLTRVGFLPYNMIRRNYFKKYLFSIGALRIEQNVDG